CMQTTKDPLTF
nr:immunoglobulin light chain junction region [Macaca mulatta]